MEKENMSLPRVLSALGEEEYFYFRGVISQNYNTIRWLRYRSICYRRLLNEDGSDCTLRDQSIETQKTIWKLLGV